MSRRREEADLARALLLSTQEAKTISNLPPHAFSSSPRSKSTQDSKEMELRVAGGGLPPNVRTFAETGVGGPVGIEGSDPIISDQSSSNVPLSVIASFTPTMPTIDSIVESPFNLVPPSMPIMTTPRTDMSPPVLVPGSKSTNGTSTTTPTTGSTTAARVAYSSPNMPIPSSRLHNSDTSHISSSASSSRPLFSPTQSSRNAVSAQEGQEASKTRVLANARPSGSARAAVPAQTADGGFKGDRRGTSPLRPSGPVLLSHSVDLAVDSSSDAEVEEQVEERPPSIDNAKKTVEVVMPTRERVSSKTESTPNRALSPDPLDSNITRRDPSSSAAPSSSAGEPTSSRTESAPMRVSSRVQDRRAKEEADKQARREARRLRKEREAKELAEAEAKEKAKSEKPSKTRAERGKERENFRKSQPSKGDMKNTPSKVPRAEEEESIPGLEGFDADKILAQVAANVAVNPDEPPSPPPRGRPPPGRPAALSSSPPASLAKALAKAPAKRKRVVADEDEEAVDDGGLGEQEPVKEPTPPPAKKATKKKSARETQASKRASRRSEIQEVTEPPKADEVQEEEQPSVEPPVEPPAVTEAETASPTPMATPELTPSPVKAQAAAVAARSPLKQSTGTVNTPTSAPYRPSPGPSNKPGGIKWKTARNDLSSMLSKFGGARQSGMSKRNKIAPLHVNIGTPARALPPVPTKPVKKKKGEESEEDSDEAEMESDGEGGLRKKPKVRGMEWYMVED